MEKLLPQNIEAEQGVLGSAIIDREIAFKLRWLQVDDFYRDAHKTIWRVIQHLVRQHAVVDELTLCEALQQEGSLEDVGGRPYVNTLVMSVVTSAHADAYATIVAEKAIARRIVHAGGQIAALPYNESDPLEWRRKALNLIVQATNQRGVDRARPLSLVLQELMEETERRAKGDLAEHLLLTGFRDLDRAIVGMEPGDFVLVAGRPRMGKSALGQQIILNIARQLNTHQEGSTCDYITLEMSSMQQARRMVAAFGEVNSQAIRSGFRDVAGEDEEYNAEMYARFFAAAETLNREVGETICIAEESMTVEELRDHLISVVESRQCRFVLVDQIDLFKAEGRQTEMEQISAASKALKQIAKDLHIVVLCLVQLNRNIENRSIRDQRPRLSDLRMSGRLEQDADMVLFVHRPCIYVPTNPNPHWSHYTEIHTAKVRDGQSGDMVPLCFTGSFASFTDWPTDWFTPPMDD